MASDELLRKALDRITLAQKKLALADKGWALLGRSRAAFISSMRHTGLSYAHAQTKFDDFVVEQSRLHKALLREFETAQRYYTELLDQAPPPETRPAALEQVGSP
jgi:hypothetical protein